MLRQMNGAGRIGQVDYLTSSRPSLLFVSLSSATPDMGRALGHKQPFHFYRLINKFTSKFFPLYFFLVFYFTLVPFGKSSL